MLPALLKALQVRPLLKEVGMGVLPRDFGKRAGLLRPQC